jgi:hypothetical protein
MVSSAGKAHQIAVEFPSHREDGTSNRRWRLEHQYVGEENIAAIVSALGRKRNCTRLGI